MRDHEAWIPLLVERLRELGVKWLDGLWSSTPCQSFSQAGKRDGALGLNGFPWMFDAIDKLKALGLLRDPHWLNVENVPGIDQHRRKSCCATRGEENWRDFLVRTHANGRLAALLPQGDDKEPKVHPIPTWCHGWLRKRCGRTLFPGDLFEENAETLAQFAALLSCPSCYFRMWILPELEKRYPWVRVEKIRCGDRGLPQKRDRVIMRCGPFPLPRVQATHSEAALVHEKWISGDYWSQLGLEPIGKPTKREESLLKKIRAGKLARDLELKPWTTFRQALVSLYAATEMDPIGYRVRGAGSNPHYAGEERKQRLITDEPSPTISTSDQGNQLPELYVPSHERHPPDTMDEPVVSIRGGGRTQILDDDLTSISVEKAQARAERHGWDNHPPARYDEPTPAIRRHQLEIEIPPDGRHGRGQCGREQHPDRPADTLSGQTEVGPILLERPLRAVMERGREGAGGGTSSEGRSVDEPSVSIAGASGGSTRPQLEVELYQAERGKLPQSMRTQRPDEPADTLSSGTSTGSHRAPWVPDLTLPLSLESGSRHREQAGRARGPLVQPIDMPTYTVDRTPPSLRECLTEVIEESPDLSDRSGWEERSSNPDEPSRTIATARNNQVTLDETTPGQKTRPRNTGGHVPPGSHPELMDRPSSIVSTSDNRGTNYTAKTSPGGPKRTSDTMYLGLRRRRATPVECWLLQGGPLPWVFVGGKTAAYKQIGNAVPPLLSYAVWIDVVREHKAWEKVFEQWNGKQKSCPRCGTTQDVMKGFGLRRCKHTRKGDEHPTVVTRPQSYCRDCRTS